MISSISKLIAKSPISDLYRNIFKQFIDDDSKSRDLKIPQLHSNEAFSSLRNQDYKGFLRFKITEDKLEAFFIGIEQIPTKWDEKKDKDKDLQSPKWMETENEKNQPVLIDHWSV